MRNGILIYKSYNNLFNIGDYIQSLAANQYIHDDVLFLNREQLNEYEGDIIKLSLNGWFLHEPKNWPPSSYIKPLFVSFHLNSSAYYILNNPTSIEYFKKHQPIGCRDKSTMKLLQENGVSAYFSGCLTLTLGEKYMSSENSESIYFVDPYFDVYRNVFSFARYIFILFSNFRKIRKICKSMFENLSIISILKTSAFYNYYRKIFDSKVLESAIYINHMLREADFACEKNKISFAEDLLLKYSNAKYIVTSRIHCALPCLGLETPVLYIENPNQAITSYCRLTGLRELLHVIQFNTNMALPLSLGINKMKIDTLFSNKTDYLVLKDKMKTTCTNFFRS
jgi:hypothetical protein